MLCIGGGSIVLFSFFVARRLSCCFPESAAIPKNEFDAIVPVNFANKKSWNHPKKRGATHDHKRERATCLQAIKHRLRRDAGVASSTTCFSSECSTMMDATKRRTIDSSVPLVVESRPLLKEEHTQVYFRHSCCLFVARCGADESRRELIPHLISSSSRHKS